MTKQKRQKIIVAVAVIAVIAAAAVWFIFLRGPQYNDNFERKSVKDVIKEANNFSGHTYQNFTLPEEINIDCGDKLYTFPVSKTKDDVDVSGWVKKLLSDFSGEEQTGELIDVSISSAGIKTDPEVDVGKGYYCDYCSDGSFVACDNNQDEYYTRKNKQSYEKEYILEKDDISGVSYNVAGQDYSIQDAIDFSMKFMDENLSDFFRKDEELVPESVCVVATERDEYYYEIFFQRKYKGCPISTNGESSYDHEFYSSSYLNVCICMPNKVNRTVLYCNGSFGKETKVKKIITLESALDYLEEYLAQYSGYVMTDISLEYCVLYEDAFDNDSEYRPMWCFTVGSSGSQLSGQYNPRKIIYLDAQTGDVSCYDAGMSQMVFKKN